MEHLVAGCASGLLSCLLLQPFDFVKTRLQQQQQKRKIVKAAEKTSIDHISGKARSVVREIVANEGVLKLWRGTVPTVLRNVPGTGIYFATLNQIRSLVSRTNPVCEAKLSAQNRSFLPVLSKTQNFLTGSVARALVGLVLMPITVVKVRYESNLYTYSSMSQAFRFIYKKEGVRGLFAGTGPTLVRDAPFAGLYVLFYEQSKQWILAWSESAKVPVPSTVQHMASGMGAGMTATVITQPFDLLKTRMQLKPMEYRSVLQAGQRVFREEGLVGFCDGLLVRTTRKTFSTAITWTVYEEIVSMYKAHR